MIGSLNNFLGKLTTKPKQIQAPYAQKRSISVNDQYDDSRPALNDIEENALEFNETNKSNIPKRDGSLETENKDRKKSITPIKPLLLIKRSQSCPTIFLNTKKKVSIASSVSMNHRLLNVADLRCAKQARSQKISIKRNYDLDCPSLDLDKRSIRTLLKSPHLDSKLNGRPRRFSEMTISFKKYSTSSGVSKLSNQQNPMLIRRHSQKIFKHSKTARTLGRNLFQYFLDFFFMLIY